MVVTPMKTPQVPKADIKKNYDFSTKKTPPVNVPKPNFINNNQLGLVLA